MYAVVEHFKTPAQRIVSRRDTKTDGTTDFQHAFECAASIYSIQEILERDVHLVPVIDGEWELETYPGKSAGPLDIIMLRRKVAEQQEKEQDEVHEYVHQPAEEPAPTHPSLPAPQSNEVEPGDTSEEFE